MHGFEYVLIFTLSLFITLVSEKRLIPILKKKAAQPIYAEGPAWHLGKSGTPTMGGICFLISIIVSGTIGALILFLSDEVYFSASLLLTLSYGLLNALIGIVDDTAKIRKRENAGLSPAEKLILQGAVASAFLIARSALLGDSTRIVFSDFSFDLGIFYYPLALIMLLGTVNCANLTDGVDGLASGVSLAVFASLGMITGGFDREVSMLSATVCGAATGFLTVNLNPAKIFMGDTGSLLFGSLAAAACISIGNPILIVFIGIIYLIEGLSVIIQVSVYKLTHKRVFRMAPLHHHLEKCGWSENKIVIWAIIITLIAAITVKVLL